VPGDLQQGLAEDLTHLEQRLNRDDFYSHGADFNTLLTKMQTCVRDAVKDLAEQQQQRVKQGAKDLELLPNWQALTEEEKNNIRAELDKLLKGSPDNLAGLRDLIGREYSLNMTVEQQKGKIQQLAQKRRQEPAQPANPVFKQSLTVPAQIRSVDELTRLLAQLQQIKDSLGGYAKIEISISIQEQE
jgi:hypothetical protein